ncbi:MAG: A/G-specific adenine glycosylase [Buchnera aphidicola (Nurudea yanoniella)]
MNTLFSQLVLNWYHENGRKNLPWKKYINPYNIWISEIMLQQTQVKTVIPYYEKFIKNFPNIKILANATIDHILHVWSGLGYYSRAHNVHSTAKIILKNYKGKFPNNFIDIVKLPGIGRTTAGAILSFGFNFHACILDCNIRRILLRYFKLHEHTAKNSEKKLWSIIESLTPIHNSNKFNQAIMDLGSLICLRSRPNCKICPLNKKCFYFSKKKWSTLNPITTQKKISKKTIFFLIILYKNLIFLRKNKISTIWKGLYCFPIFSNQLEILEWIKNKKIKIKNQKISTTFIHKLSHIQLFCIPISIQIKNLFSINEVDKHLWFNKNNPQRIGLPSPIKKIINNTSHF